MKQSNRNLIIKYQYRLESRHLEKFSEVSAETQNLDSKINDSNLQRMELKMDLKRLIQHNSDKIAHLRVHATNMEKFEAMTKTKIEEIIFKIKTNRQEAQERDEGVERRMTTKVERLERKSDDRFEILQKGECAQNLSSI